MIVGVIAIGAGPTVSGRPLAVTVGGMASVPPIWNSILAASSSGGSLLTGSRRRAVMVRAVRTTALLGTELTAQPRAAVPETTAVEAEVPVSTCALESGPIALRP